MSKDYCKLKKTKYSKLRNLALFYVWKDARIWAHWNHSFDMHFLYQGPVFCVFTSWVSSGLTLGSGCCLLSVSMERILSLLSTLRAHQLTFQWWMTVISFVCWYGRKYSLSQHSGLIHKRTHRTQRCFFILELIANGCREESIKGESARDEPGRTQAQAFACWVPSTQHVFGVTN